MWICVRDALLSLSFFLARLFSSPSPTPSFSPSFSRASSPPRLPLSRDSGSGGLERRRPVELRQVSGPLELPELFGHERREQGVQEVLEEYEEQQVVEESVVVQVLRVLESAHRRVDVDPRVVRAVNVPVSAD